MTTRTAPATAAEIHALSTRTLLVDSADVTFARESGMYRAWLEMAIFGSSMRSRRMYATKREAWAAIDAAVDSGCADPSEWVPAFAA